MLAHSVRMYCIARPSLEGGLAMRLSKRKYALSFWNLRLAKSLLASLPFLNGLGTSLLSSHVKNAVIGNGQTWFLYSKRRLLTQHIWEVLQVWPGPFPDFWVGPKDEATLSHTCINRMHEQTQRPFIVFSFSTTFTRLLMNLLQWTKVPSVNNVVFIRNESLFFVSAAAICAFQLEHTPRLLRCIP